jgi:hypothetical protein
MRRIGLAVVLSRRRFVVMMSAGLPALPHRSEAQEARKVYRIGVLNGSLLPSPPADSPFFDRLGELGWVEGRDSVAEQRPYADRLDRVPDLAAELVR